MSRQKQVFSGLVVGLLVLAGCGGGNRDYSREEMAPSPEMQSISKMAALDEMDGAPIQPDQAQPEPGVEQYIAYSHSLGLTLAKGNVEPLMQQHTEACRAAGTETCIVINSNIYAQDIDYASGHLSIRATPDWIDAFMAGIEQDASAAGGEITRRSSQAEDLTRQIIDTGARLEAQETLQGRLQTLLERRDGDLGDLLQIERELARVTGEIESIKAQLKALRLRVSMSSLDLNYETRRAVNGARHNPLGEAFSDFFYNLSGAVAAVITAFAVGLPWVVLLGVFLWIWLKLIWPRLRGKKRPGKTG
jgi:hypothetical protein